MTRSPITTGAMLLAIGVVLSGCGGDGSPYDPPLPPGESGASPESADFKTFVREQFSATADDTDPRDVDEIGFEFNDQNDPEAFGDLLDES